MKKVITTIADISEMILLRAILSSFHNFGFLQVRSMAFQKKGSLITRMLVRATVSGRLPAHRAKPAGGHRVPLPSDDECHALSSLSNTSRPSNGRQAHLACAFLIAIPVPIPAVITAKR
jgi:hypothetical protein